MTRKRGVMPEPLFRKIISEAAGIPRIDHYTLTGLGETLLDPKIVERIAFIRRVVGPAAMLDLYTNGSFLTADKVTGLIEGGISTIYVSLNAVRPSQRQEIMRLDDFDKTVEQCDAAINLAKGTRTKIVIKAVYNKDLFEHGDSDMFVDRWGGRWDEGGHAYLHLEGNWAGEMWKMRTKPITPCARALNEIMVLWDGRVSLCCFDGEGKIIFGDLNKQTIREIFAGERASEYRKAHVEGRRQDLDLCRDCTAI